MTEQRTVVDWVWTFVGVAGVACIGVAAWMFLGGGREQSPEEVLKERAERADAHWKAGRARLDAGEAEAAVEEIEAAIELVGPRNPAVPILRNDLGRAYLAAGREEDAARQFSVSLTLQPTFFAPYLRLGRLFEEKGSPVAAWQYQRAALALHPEPVPPDLEESVRALGERIGPEREKEVSTFRARWKANPADVNALTALLVTELLDTGVPADAPPAEAIRRALLAAGEGIGDLGALRSAQEGAVADRPGSVVDRAGLGNVLLLSGDWERAAEVFREAIGLSGSDPAARQGAALAALVTGTEAGDEAVEAAYRLQNSPLAWLVLAATNLSRGNSKEARDALGKALRLNPALPEVYRLFALAMTGEDLSESRKAAARAHARLTE